MKEKKKEVSKGERERKKKREVSKRKKERVQFNSLSGSGNVLLLTTVLLVQDQRGE